MLHVVVSIGRSRVFYVISVSLEHIPIIPPHSTFDVFLSREKYIDLLLQGERVHCNIVCILTTNSYVAAPLNFRKVKNN